MNEPVKVRSNSRSFRSRSNGDITVRLYPEDYAALETLGKTLSPIVPLPVSDLIRYMIRNFPLEQQKEDLRDVQDARRAMDEIAEKGAIPWEEAKKQLRARPKK